MKLKLRSYSDLFDNLFAWAIGTALSHFIIYLLAFILLSFAYTSIASTNEAEAKDNELIFQFEKYLTLAVTILTPILFLLSLILTFAVLHHHKKLLNVWIIASLVYAPILTLGLLAAGIYLTIMSSYVGYITIPISLLLLALKIHSILLIYGFKLESEE